jgi:hypothetical protein
MQFTDYFKYDDILSENNLPSSRDPSGYLKLKFTYAPKINGISYDVDFLFHSSSIFLSLWIDTQPASSKFRHEFTFSCSADREEYKEKFNRLHNKMDTIDAYFDVIEEEYINKIIDRNGGLEMIFQETLKKMLE